MVDMFGLSKGFEEVNLSELACAVSDLNTKIEQCTINIDLYRVYYDFEETIIIHTN